MVAFVSDPVFAAQLRASLVPGPLAGQVEVMDAGWLARKGLDAVHGLPVSVSHDRWGEEVVMDRHRLDVCLSIGRHAAERAKLAGRSRILCMGLEADWPSAEMPPVEDGVVSRPGLEPKGTVRWSAVDRRDVYESLREQGTFSASALVGAMIASAQMGLWVEAVGPLARVAAALAARLNPEVRAWIGGLAAEPIAMEGMRVVCASGARAASGYSSASDSSVCAVS
ncbi:hypothetical protein CKO23_08055 [Thiocystis violacea]|nr:hypothetical protein [Thiocystis violacea]